MGTRGGEASTSRASGRKDVVQGKGKGKEQEEGSEQKPQVEQSRKERRVLRARYRDVKSTIAGEKEDLGKVDSEKFTSFYHAIQDLHHLVQKPREQISDAEALLDMASTLVDTARGASRKNGLSPSDFVDALINKFGRRNRRGDGQDADIDWGALGLEACLVLPEAPGLCTMVGPMESEPKARRAYAPRGRKERLDRMTQPEEVEEASSSREKKETDANMEVMFAKLKGLRRVQMEALVLNRVSFAQTVENIFSLSFLVRDGRVEIKIGDDGSHSIVPRNAPSNEQGEQGGETSQFVLSVGFKDWELMKQKVEDGAEVMPNRSGVQLPSHQASVTPVRITSRNRARENSSQEEPQLGRQHHGKRRKLALDDS